MDDTGKPFACPSPGCNMSFTNEDHLTVHKKKHDMILNFGMNGKGSVFIADQTPTPTRFIRNCEEVGLFQDLQNENPFEETFRRAVEAGKIGSISVSEVGNADDTLHTPHIFPHIVDSPATNQVLTQTTISVPPTITVTETSNERSSTKTKICSSTEVSKKNSHAEEVVKKLKITTTCTNSIQTTERIVVQEPGTLIVPKVPAVQTPAPLSINGEEVQLLLKTSDGKLLQLSAAPVIECQRNTNNIQPVILKTEPPLRTANEAERKSSEASKLSIAKMKLKQALTKSLAETENERMEKPPEKVKDSSQSKENRRKNIDQYKKQDVLERNRASSMRSRAKRKAWIQQLETTVKNVNEKNTMLQTEVKSLRSEVAKLKALLLAHKDCPITKAMEKGNSIVVSSKVNIIPANTEIIPAIPFVSDATIKRAACPTEAPIASKKLTLATGKNPIILPKSDNQIKGALPRARLIKKLPALKIVDVDPLQINEEDKQFVILQGSPSNTSESIPRDIIQINPIIDVDNAASKSTGT